ncbi:MAG: hypothetical protein WCT23_00815 [Candidatus Neomarinimicrobiota bacterium]
MRRQLKLFKEFEHPILTKYCLLGLIISTLVFQFVTMSLIDQRLRFDALWSTETFIRLVSILIGALVGGSILLLIPPNKLLDFAIWKRLRSKGELSFIFVNVFAFSIALFVGGLVFKALDMETYDHFFASLFSIENIIDYSGRIIAAAVFGVFYSLGMIKRMNKKYL